jgi:hypothetical protein
MSEVIISNVVDGAITFAMANPLAFTSIAIAGLFVYGAIEISKNCSNDKNDEDRNVGNRNGKIRQS